MNHDLVLRDAIHYLLYTNTAEVLVSLCLYSLRKVPSLPKDLPINNLACKDLTLQTFYLLCVFQLVGGRLFWREPGCPAWAGHPRKAHLSVKNSLLWGSLKNTWNVYVTECFHVVNKSSTNQTVLIIQINMFFLLKFARRRARFDQLSYHCNQNIPAVWYASMQKSRCLFNILYWSRIGAA